MKYNIAKLPNGLRIIQLPSESPVVYCGYAIKAGTRNELPGEEGLAHFCEHATFKGTERRNARNIINCLESVGGDINAYTKKEETVYYAAVPKEYTPKAIDLLTDIVFHSTYPQKEIDKEVEVICDEIESYNDSPADLIFDEFENILFNGSPLGHNILGTKARVRSFTTDDALRFTRRYYRPDNAVFFIYGSYKGADIGKLLQKNFNGYKDSGMPRSIDNINIPGTTESQGQVIIRDKGTHQAHVMLGCPAYDDSEAQRSKRTALNLLNNILGGSAMNSRLNIVLREQNGLVYTVESSAIVYTGTGLWCAYLGCDGKDVNKCLRLVHKELDKYRNKPISGRKLDAAKKQLKGQIGIESDNHENFALDFGSIFLHENEARDLDMLYQRIDTVTPQDIQAVANEIFNPERMTTLIYK